MTIAVGAFSAGAFSTTGTVTTAAITTAASGSSFVGFVADDGTTGNIPTDSKTNTYTRIGTRFTGVANLGVYLCTNGTGGAGHTLNATSTGGSTDLEAYLLEITGGALASLVDAFPGTQWNDDLASPFTSNAVTTTNAIDLILAFTATVTTSGTETLTWGNSFTQVVADGSSAHFSGGIAQLITGSTGTFNSTFTSAGGGTAEAISTVIAFKNASSTAPFQPFTQNQFFVNDVQQQQ